MSGLSDNETLHLNDKRKKWLVGYNSKDGSKISFNKWNILRVFFIKDRKWAILLELLLFLYVFGKSVSQQQFHIINSSHFDKELQITEGKSFMWCCGINKPLKTISLKNKINNIFITIKNQKPQLWGYKNKNMT